MFDARVGLVGVGGLLLDPGAVANRSLVDGVSTPALTGGTIACADGEQDAVPVSGSDDHMLRLGWAVDEVPRAKGAFLTFHDQQRFSVEDEEVFLVGLPVVHRHRLTRREDPQVDPDLREALGSLEDAKCAAARR